jgi:hypothetical protein
MGSLAAIAASAFVFAGSAHAVTAWGTDAAGELTGSRSVAGGGLTVGTDAGSHSWTDFGISWVVEPGTTMDWKYTYTLTGMPPDPSHFWIEITEGATSDEITLANGPVVGPQNYDGSNGGSDPAWPEDGNGDPIVIYGFKIDTSASVYTFETDHTPVYGNFFTKGGQKSVYNTGFLSWDGTEFADDDIAHYIVRPNGLPEVEEPPPGATPEPVTATMGAMGLLALAIRATRRRR